MGRLPCDPLSCKSHSPRTFPISFTRSTSKPAEVNCPLAILSSNMLAADTSRLGATLDVEHSHVRFFGSLYLVRSFWSGYPPWRSLLISAMTCLALPLPAGTMIPTESLGLWRSRSLPRQLCLDSKSSNLLQRRYPHLRL